MMLALLMADNPLEHVVQHPLVQRPADLGLLTPEGKITLLSDQIVVMILAGLLLTLLVPVLVRRRRSTDVVGRLIPTGFANFFEAICQYLRKEVAEPNLGEHTDRFIKYIWTAFFFVLVNNLLGLLPIAPLMGIAKLHIGGTATSNIWVTGTLALMTLVMMVVNGLRLGGKHYLAHFSPGPIWLAWLLIPVEIIGTFAKTAALAIRLFANMVAGHVLLAVLLSFIFLAAAGGVGIGVPVVLGSVLGSVAVNLLELFVAFLQAYIFTFLTTLFIGQSVVFHHGGEHHAEGAAAHH